MRLYPNISVKARFYLADCLVNDIHTLSSLFACDTISVAEKVALEVQYRNSSATKVLVTDCGRGNVFDPSG